MLPVARAAIGSVPHTAAGRRTTEKMEELEMSSVAKVTEITAGSKKSFEDAIEQGISRASKTLDQVAGAWVQEMKVDVKDGRIVRYRVNMKVTFVLKD